MTKCTASIFCILCYRNISELKSGLLLVTFQWKANSCFLWKVNEQIILSQSIPQEGKKLRRPSEWQQCMQVLKNGSCWSLYTSGPASYLGGITSDEDWKKGMESICRVSRSEFKNMAKNQPWHWSIVLDTFSIVLIISIYKIRIVRYFAKVQHV